MAQFRPFKPAFIIGVTGHMDPDPGQSEKVKKALKRVFDWLRNSSKNKELRRRGLNLRNTPIILLSSLAPGADQWAVEVAEEIAKEEEQKAKEAKQEASGIHIVAPLPFHKDQYLQASTFMRAGVDKGAKDFLAKFPDKDTFVVRLVDEVDADEEKLRANHQSMLTGSARETERHRRYLAAGEYVAAYSDILLALTDEPIRYSDTLIHDESPSAKAIAKRKLRGMFGLLPTSPALGGSDSGPVIHIYTPRAPKEGSVSPATEASHPGQMQMLFPHDCRPEKDRGDYADKRWQKKGYRTLRAIAEKFEMLNKEKVKAVEPERQKNFFGMLADDGLPPTLSPRDNYDCLRNRLTNLAKLRRHVADRNRHYDSLIQNLKRTLFFLAFFSALFFAFSESWVPTRDTDVARKVRTWCFEVAVGCTLTSWVVFTFHRINLNHQKSDDYRAIAEGLRVQFYWTAVGSGESVASNYLQRLRGEIGWIRCVISAASFPYEPMRSIYESLFPPKEQRKEQGNLFNAIRNGWVKEQLKYFTKNVDKLTRHQSFFVHYSWIMLTAAFVLYILNFCLQNSGFCQFCFRHATPIVTRSQGLGLVGAAIAIFFIFFLIRWCQNQAEKSPREPRPIQNQAEKSPGKPPPIIDRILSALFSVFNMFLPKGPGSVRFEEYLIRVPLCIAATMLVIGIAYYVRGVEPWIPSPIKISAILRNLLLAGGVLCGLWVSTNHLTENKQRYESMKSMFKGVNERFDKYLEPRDGTDSVDEPVFHDMRSLIVATGREALSENAEWLFTHRVRPVEPVSP